MALSAPSTPKNNFMTPRRLGNTRTAPPETPECFNTVTVETPIFNIKRRCSKDNKYDEVSNLTVAVRIRPMCSRELSVVGVSNVVTVKDQDLIIRSGFTSNSLITNHIFQYDHIFWSCEENDPLYASQEDVFLTIGKPMLNSAFHGYNACLFAYGQTGSGKSYSMMGLNPSLLIDINSDQNSGITPRFCRDLFKQINELNPKSTAAVEISYFEIYNEKIHDLLAVNTTNRTPLKVREHPIWGPYVVDLSVHNVKTYDELRNWLLLGNKNRATAATVMNENSSRSHSIFSIELCLSDGLSEGDSSRRSKISLVDLAGSERLSTSHNTEERIRQGVSINKSLLTLGKVISALAEQKKNQFVPYRDSVLTWLLRESLGGNSLTSMLATISPASNHVDETLATLRYACQARSIVNRARINENPHDRLIRELRAEVERLRALRQDYERNSLSSVLHVDDSLEHVQELEVLREKLSLTESKLLEAQESWERRFMETKENQLKELAESEKRREELESRVRVMKCIDTNIKLSPYKTNFLEKLEDVLVNDTQNYSALQNFKNCCYNLGLNFDFTLNEDKRLLTIIDVRNKRKTTCSLEKIEKLIGCENTINFIEKLTWNNIFNKNNVKKCSKSDITTSMNQIYQALSVLQPFTEEEDKLSLLFARVNKSLQSLETALMNKYNNNSQKSVTFNL